MARIMSLNELEIENAMLDTRNVQQRITYTDTAVQSNAFTDAKIVVLFPTTDCWVKFDSDPTAAVNDGSSIFCPSDIYRAFRPHEGDKLSVIRDATNGYLHIHEGA